jgi:hypothetical protein
MSRTRRIVVIGAAVVIVGFIALQFVGNFVPTFARTNPSVTYKINWNTPETEQLMRAACYDCHSNETIWPWYSNIAPISWLIAKDVNEGRRKLNFSTGHGEIEAEELVRQIERGEMPPSIFLIMHPEANLSGDQKATLVSGIKATLGGGLERGEAGEETDRDND